jgi:hypothetical protein
VPKFNLALFKKLLNWKNYLRIIVYGAIIIYITLRLDDYRMFNKYQDVDSDFTKYTQVFNALLSAAELETYYSPDTIVPIKFVDKLPGNAIGTTYHPIFGKPEIEISKEAWGDLDDSGRTILVLHELVHATCNISNHANGYLLDFECPASIMNWQVPSAACREKYFIHYMMSLAIICRQSALDELEPE